MHKVSDEDLYWAFWRVARELTPARLIELRQRGDGPRRRLIGDLVEAIRAQGWEVLAFKMPPPQIAVDSVPNGKERVRALEEAGREVERTTRDIIDAMCKVTASDPRRPIMPRLPL